MAELTDAVATRSIEMYEIVIQDKTDFKNAVKRAKTEVVGLAKDLNVLVKTCLESYVEIRARLNNLKTEEVYDVRNVFSHLHTLMFPKFITETPHRYLIHYPRYLEAIKYRLSKFQSSPGRDIEWQKHLDQYEQQIDAMLKSAVDKNHIDLLIELRWSLEELRVSLWAQQLRTLYPISFKRIERRLTEIAKQPSN